MLDQDTAFTIPKDLPEHVESVTADNGIVKVLLKAGNEKPKWTIGANALFHFWAYGFFVEESDDHKHDHKHDHDHSHQDNTKKQGNQNRAAMINMLSSIVNKDKQQPAKNSASPKKKKKTKKSESTEKVEKKPQRKKVVDSFDYDPKVPFSIRIGRKFSFEGMEIAVKSMLIGERAKFMCIPEYGKNFAQLASVIRKEKQRRLDPSGPTSGHQCAASYGHNHDDQDLHQLYSSPLELEIELLDVEQPGEFERQTWEISAVERYGLVSKFKQEAVEFYNRARYSKSLEKFTKCLELLESLIMHPVVSDMNREAGRALKKRLENLKSIQKTINVDGTDFFDANLDFNSRSIALSVYEENAYTNDDEKAAKLIPLSNEGDKDLLEVISLSEMRSLIVTCRLNYAMCLLKLKTNYTGVVSQCTLLLKDSDPLVPSADSLSHSLDPKFKMYRFLNPLQAAKAHFRRGQAYSRIGRDLELAEDDFSSVNQIISYWDPAEASTIKNDLQQENLVLGEKWNEFRKREKNMYTKIFEK